jgi:hypothetical protein
MTSEDFHRLNYTGQTETVLKATFLADRLTDRAYVRLYSLDSFYIEAFFDDHTKLITHFRAFEQTLFVMRYLNELKIAV